MKIYLFLPDRILSYNLPKEISGSFSFDPNPEEESKLINIEARNSQWTIYSTNDVDIIKNDSTIKELPLESDDFYYLRRTDTTYLIYVIYAENFREKEITPYQYDKNINLIIGNTDNCNIRYNFNFKNKVEIRIHRQDNGIILEKIEGSVYVNNILVSKTKYLNIGDQVNIFGLKLILLTNIILINHSLAGKLYVLEEKAGIRKYRFPSDEQPINVEIKDKDLYDKSNYFSKSPRLRRTIETKEIIIDAPPDDGINQEMPMLLVIGPMITMGATSAVSLINAMARVSSGESTLEQQLPSLITCIAMLVSMLGWPLITRIYNKHMQKAKKKEIKEKYEKYLLEKKEELAEEEKLQRDIINENLITTEQCLSIIKDRNLNFWSKRIDQSDFLVARIGIGNEKLDVEIKWPEEGFTIEESELKKSADRLIEEYKYIKNVPLAYSFSENRITAVMGNDYKTVNFINNIVVQLLAFYSYEDLKLVIITNENNAHIWEYMKYLNHTFNNERNFRFFASDIDSAKEVFDYLTYEINNRMNDKKDEHKPHYLVIVDDYSKVKRHDFISTLTEAEEDNLGFSLIIRENMLKNLPSKCDNFITLSDGVSGILKSAYENQEQVDFRDEIAYNIDMMSLTKTLSNIPIEFEDGLANLPDVISFLEMEKVGKVEQLNILNRWNTNDSTASLRAEIGVDEQENVMYLDLHEKNHGPHGLIAGTTGSGKSEFIITYILSMCINYSPDDISFILIDYKGGGLALAFENKATGAVLPHLAGTITNLDKAEMDRTLVSIKSEAQRRQRIFNEVRDNLGESTMDIYKYQRHYHDGRVKEAIPHLFIICDEFAELKAQQPEFMDDLISIARIGRSLGVHLILATQKPSGVVTDQIWSNTRFRVCLKVQDESDSKEMLKKPDAAHIKQAGRFFLQVGYDEYYAQGQSGWCGAKYYPSDKIVKQVDKSINFINDCGQFIKSIQAATEKKQQAQGEQLSNIMSSIIEVSNMSHKKARRLWLENIPEIILEDEIEKKYNVTHTPYNIEAVIGEYDAPELQEQGIVTYNLLNEGNTIIYGNDSIEREMLLNSIIYSVTKNHAPEEVNFYMLDFGSESLRVYEKLPHFSGVATVSEEKRINNLFDLISEEVAKRKRKFFDFGGEYRKYIENSDDKMPLLVIIVNNFDTMKDNFDDLVYSTLPEVTRDSERYGIIYVITATGYNSVRSSVLQNFKNYYAFKLKESYDYRTIFNKRKDIMPRDIMGRGILFNKDDLHEFQTISVAESGNDGFIKNYVDETVNKYKDYDKYLPLPILPDKVRIDNVIKELSSLSNVPIGISADTVEIQNIDFISNLGTVISAKKLDLTTVFVRSLIQLIKNISGINIIILDPLSQLNIDKNQVKNYYTDNFEETINSIKTYIDNLITTKSSQSGIIIIYGVDSLMKENIDTTLLEELTTSLQNYGKVGTIFVEANNKFKNYQSNKWIKNVSSNNNGIWIGNDISSQSAIMCNVNRNMSSKLKDDMGYLIVESSPTLCKLLDFYTTDDE